MPKRKKKQEIFTPTGRSFDPLGQNATDEELIQMLADILVEGFLVRKAQEKGKDAAYYEEELHSFRLERLLKDPYSEIQKD